MPLVKKPGKKARQENVKREIAAGKPAAQAEAIAYSVERESRRKRR